MAEIEKKYSDYQQSDCKAFEQDSPQPIDDKLCPTCEPDPNFKLEANWWEIEESYLNGKDCEYHVRVYENETAVKQASEELDFDTDEDVIKHIAAGRILVDNDKPLNAGTRTQVQNACYIKDSYRDIRSGELGEAFLVAVPAFNFDSIESNDESIQEDESNIASGGEIILGTDKLFRKMRQIRLTLNTYGSYYRAAQITGKGFVIREKDDETKRISYRTTSQNFKRFVDLLQDALVDKGFAKLGSAGVFKSKRASKIKIIFKQGSEPFELKSIWVLPDDGCGKYQNLKIKKSSELAKSKMKPIYNFLQNLDSVISDITSKERKPWLDFTIDNFYPTYIVDYGDISDLESTRSGLECLLQDQLGLGNGQIIDSLSKEIMSAFKLLEKEMAEEACRALKEDREQKSPTQMAEERQEPPTPLEERQAAMKKRYENEYKNGFLAKAKKEVLRDSIKNGKKAPQINSKNLFKVLESEGFVSLNAAGQTTFSLKQISYAPDEFKVSGKPVKPQPKTTFSIYSDETLDESAKDFAEFKFNLLEEGSFSNQIQNSPHFHEALESAREVFDDPGNTFIKAYKDSRDSKNEISFLDMISSLGVCGMTKTAGKALECLAGGVSFDRFIGILIEKIFEYMEVNTLSLFLNGLPADFRRDLNEEIQKQFGDIKLSDLFELKKAENPNQKLKDFIKSKQVFKRVLESVEKLGGKPLSGDDYEYLLEHLPIASIKGHVDELYVINTLPDALDQEIIEENLKEFKKKLKKDFRKFKRMSKNFKTAIRRMGETLDGFVVTANEPEELDKFSRSVNAFSETSLGVKVDAVYDVVFDFAIDSILDSFGLDDLLARLQKYPIVDFVSGVIDRFLDKCDVPPIMHPPPGDFLKGLSVDICDPTVSVSLPVINIPNTNLRFLFESQFGEIFREAIIKLASEVIIKIMKKLLSTLEGALCNTLEAAGGFVADGVKNGFGETFDEVYGSFVDALNKAFCNDGENPDTAESRAKELADALFSPLLFDSGSNFEGSGARVSNVISSVASAPEFLEAMVAREGEENDQFNKRISNAVNALTPEMSSLLGDPNQVAYFFRNLGSFLTPEDRDRIRNLLDAGVPNLPVSPALCLTNDQLRQWDDLRNNLLQDQGLTPEQAREKVKDLNDKTDDALREIFDIVGDLETDGPFVGSLTNEAMKDVCNPNNVINTSAKSQFEKDLEDDLIDGFFNNLTKGLIGGFFNKGGIFSEALRDKEDRREFARDFIKLFNSNYTNSQSERDLKYGNKNFIGQTIMDALTVSGSAIGIYPETVGIQQRKQVLEDEAQSFSFTDSGRNKVSIKFKDSSDDFEYEIEVAANNSVSPKSSFDYEMSVEENSYESGLFGDSESETLASFLVPVTTTEREVKFFESQGFQITTNESRDIRKQLFTKIIKNKVDIPDSAAGKLYEDLYRLIGSGLSKSLLTDSSQQDDIPIGYKFGYISEDLTKDSFKYTPSENEGELGTFASSRIKPLDPAIYGGSYKRPAYYVEPRQFFGWLELGTKAFSSSEGCDPKTPPLFDMSDVKNRVKDLNSRLRDDPRLTKPLDCVNEKPFHLLLDKKNKSTLDGVLRSTIRTYLGEYFVKGYGLFSNLQIRSKNFDDSMLIYIVNKMKSEMQDLGTFTSNKKVRIVRERYWYTFLEQCVEAYQRMIDVDGIEPPEEVFEALNRIQIGLDKYRPVTTRVRKLMRKRVSENPLIQKPNEFYDSVSLSSNSNVELSLQSVAFRLSEDRDNFFDGQSFEGITPRDIRFASLKKLNFFKKIYFIKIFEKEAILIMSEFIKDELNRLASNVVDGISDKPHYYDLHRSFFGMTPFFPDSTSRVGTNQFYSDKQEGKINTGLIPEIKANNSTTPVAPTDEPQLVLESYVRLKERGDAPQFIRGRQAKYTGFVSLTNMSEFVNSNLDLFEDGYLSDYFGNLSFTYETEIKNLFDKGFANEDSVRRLIELNKDRGAIMPSLINDAFTSYVLSQQFENISVIYDESFVLEGEKPTPVGTIGETGVKYGMRLSVVLPTEMASRVPQTSTLLVKSMSERAYFFQDGGVMIPLLTSEFDVKDSRVEDFDPFSGVEPYDLECLINKMVEGVEFQVLMDKVFNFKQTASMLSIYCMESLPAAIGRDESERNEVDDDPDVDEWDRVTNKIVKNFLRREFKSIYLIRHPDGQSPDDDDSDSDRLRIFSISNPLDFLALPSIRLPWWLKRRMRTNVYDANGQECADPKKDLQ